MKRFQPYRDIRKKAAILGLPLNYFGLQMVSVIGSLMMIIFSFGWMTILSALIGNSLLFFGLQKLSHTPGLLNWKKNFPKRISNKRHSHLNYE